MNWDAIGAVGEIVGAAAVVVTLFYLARQIHHGTRMARAEMTKDLLLASRTAIMDVTSNDRLAEIWAEIRPFPDPAAARRHTFYQSFFRMYELQHSLAREGLIDDTISVSYQLVIRMFAKTRFFDQYWAGARGEFNATFADYVDEQIRIARAEGEAAAVDASRRPPTVRSAPPADPRPSSPLAREP